MKKFGIDISEFQGGMDLAKAKADGVEFAILRAGYTGYGSAKGKAKDGCFEKFYKKCKELNIPVGAYWFSRAVGKTEGEKEADYFYNKCLKGKQFEYPVVIDVEDTVYQSKASKQAVTEAIIGFCEYLENKGYYVAIYANTSWFSSKMDTSKLVNYDKWVAYWGKTRPSKPAGNLWQFGGETNCIRTNKVAGMVCDQDYAYIDYPSIIKNADLNGFTATKQESKPITPTEPKKTVEELANEVIADKWGTDKTNPTRKERLTNAGYNYSEVQAKVNEILSEKEEVITYTVQKGDYLIKIGKKFNVNWKDIAKLNNIKGPFYIIHTGQVLKIK